MVDLGAATVVNDKTEFIAWLKKLSQDTVLRERSGKAAQKYIISQAGATQTLLEHLEKDGVFSNAF